MQKILAEVERRVAAEPCRSEPLLRLEHGNSIWPTARPPVDSAAAFALNWPRGYLSRPACRHVKQGAKRPGLLEETRCFSSLKEKPCLPMPIRSLPRPIQSAVP